MNAKRLTAPAAHDEPDAMEALPRRLIVASGLGPSAMFSRKDLASAASVILPSTPNPPMASPTREARALMGRRTPGAVQGLVRGAEWVAIALESQAELVRAAEPLVKVRGGDTQTLATPEEIAEYWAREHADGLRAVCLLGTHIPWETHERMQQDGALIGRIPIDDEDLLHGYAQKLSDRERARTPASRNACLVTPGQDAFTQNLRELFVRPLTDALKQLGFAVTIYEPGHSPPEAMASAGIIVLLTHGADGSDAGAPIGIDGYEREALMMACGRGAWVLHLGCNGAGTFAGGRFGRLISELRLDDAPVSASDTIGRFAADCIQAGSRGVVAHVDSTWSNAFEQPDAVVAWVDWIGSGAGALALAGEDFSREAGRAAIDAFEAQARGAPEAGLSWMRHLDLRGFVALGDPSSWTLWG